MIGKRSRRIKVFLTIICLFTNWVAIYGYNPPDNYYHNLTLASIEKIPERDINIGLWALIIAKEYHKTIDINKYLKQFDDMVVEIRKMLAGRTSDMDKFLAVKMFIYTLGVWNNYRPFSYDLDDPLGKVREHQLLSYYMDTRKGNCVSMPTFCIALMERLDNTIPFVGVKAPLHLFCRLKDRQTNDVWNVETTNGGEPARNQWYIDQSHISETAIKSGLYMKDLTRKEFIAALMGVLISKERYNGNLDKGIYYADLALRLDPNDDMALINKGALIAERCYQEDKVKPKTDEEKKKCDEEAGIYINKAKTLGWQNQTDADRQKYMNSVKREKARIKQEKK